MVVCNDTTISSSSVLPEEHIVYVYVLPIISTIGIVCNTLTLFTLADRSFDKTLSWHAYLCAMAIADIITCSAVMLLMLNRCKNCSHEGSIGYIRAALEVYVALPVNNISATLSGFVTLFLAIDRFAEELKYTDGISVSQRFGIGTLATARCLIVGSAAFAAFSNVHYFFQKYIDECNVPHYTWFYNSNWYAMFTGLNIVWIVLICIILGVINLLLVANLSKPRELEQESGRIERRHLQVTLICIILLFLVGNIPVICAFRRIAELFGDTKAPNYKRYRAGANILLMISFASNFFVYFNCYPSFRDALFSRLRFLANKCNPPRAGRDKSKATNVAVESGDHVIPGVLVTSPCAGGGLLVTTADRHSSVENPILSDLNTTIHLTTNTPEIELTNQASNEAGNSLDVVSNNVMATSLDEQLPLLKTSSDAAVTTPTTNEKSTVGEGMEVLLKH